MSQTMLQGKENVSSLRISMDETTNKFLSEIERFTKEGMNFPVSKSVLLRRAVHVYFAHLILNLKKAARSDDKISAFNKLARTERENIRFAARQLDLPEPTQAQVNAVIEEVIREGEGK